MMGSMMAGTMEDIWPPVLVRCPMGLAYVVTVVEAGVTLSADNHPLLYIVPPRGSGRRGEWVHPRELETPEGKPLTTSPLMKKFGWCAAMPTKGWLVWRRIHDLERLALEAPGVQSFEEETENE